VKTIAQAAWTVDKGHRAIVSDYLGDTMLAPDDPLRENSPVGVLFHTRAAAIAATEAHLRATAERLPVAVAPVPPWGPHFCDTAWIRAHGEPSWEWRVHRLEIRRAAAEVVGVEVAASFDYRIMADQRVQTFAEVDGERIAAGWTTAKAPAADWAPLVYLKSPGDCGNGDPEDPQRRAWRSWVIEPVQVTLMWGDAQ